MWAGMQNAQNSLHPSPGFPWDIVQTKNGASYVTRNEVSGIVLNLAASINVLLPTIEAQVVLQPLDQFYGEKRDVGCVGS